MRIGFENFGGPGWTGGSTYLSNLLRAVRVAGGPGVRTTVFDRPGSPAAAEVAAAADAVVRLADDLGPRGRFGRVAASVRRRVGLPGRGRNPLDAALKANGIDVYFSPFESAVGLTVPWATWITDFQHRRLPSMFTSAEVGSRDRVYRSLAADAGAVVLSSEDARSDFERFAPESAHKARVVRFVVPIADDVYAADGSVTVDKYHLPEKFFYMPNQLWKHKNVEVVLDALAILKGEGHPAAIVHTGGLVDYRDPLYASHVLGRIAEAGVHDALVMLGLVPRADLMNLYRQSVAVLQPSRFEGWSTSVEECKSLGKRVVLSDLPVHREQSPPAASYFPPDSAAALADRLREVWAAADAGPDLPLEREARAALPDRFAEFGRTFVETVRAVG